MISYYELLQMVKEGKEPKKIELHLVNDSRRYIAKYDGASFSHYCLENKYLEAENFKYYLADSLLESQMFGKCIEVIIEIIGEKPKIEKLKLDYEETITHIMLDMEEKINKIIDCLLANEKDK